MTRFNFRRLAQRKHEDALDILDVRVEPSIGVANEGEDGKAVEAASSHRGLFKRFRKSEARAKATRPAKPPKAPKAKKAAGSKARGRSVSNATAALRNAASRLGLTKSKGPAPVNKLNAADVLIVTDQGQQKAWWRANLSADTVEEIPATKVPEDYLGEFDPAPLAAPILSFSVQDYTAPIKRNDRKGGITAQFERNEGMKVDIVPRAKNDTVAFGATGSWIANFAPQRVFPGTFALQLLLQKQMPKRFPAIVGFIFQRTESPLLVLYQLESNGQLHNVAYVPRAGGQNEIAMALRSFADEKAIQITDDWMNEQMVLFTAADLAPVLSQLRAYPSESAIGNVPVRQLWALGCAASAVCLAASIVWVGVETLSLHAEQSRLEDEAARADHTQREISSLAERRFSDFVSLAGIDPIPGLMTAQSVYVPGAEVEILARRGAGVALTVIAPAADAAAQELRSAPAGCRREALTTTSNANIIQAKYECAPPGFDFSPLFAVRRSLRERAIE